MVNRHKDGDFRARHLTADTPEARVLHEEIAPWVMPLVIYKNPARDLRTKLALIQKIRKIMGQYLLPSAQARSEFQFDRPKSLRKLPGISRSSVTLAKQLESLHPDILETLTLRGPSGRKQIDVVRFAWILRQFAAKAQSASETLEPAPPGAPSQANLDTAVAKLVPLFERLRLKVTERKSNSAVVRKRVMGPGGQLLLQIFQHFDRHQTTAMIYGSIERYRAIQKELNKVKARERNAKRRASAPVAGEPST